MTPHTTTKPSMDPVEESDNDEETFSQPGEESLRKRKYEFPYKLYKILEDMETQGRTDVVSWLPNGDAFRIHNVDAFANEVLPAYFSGIQYKSFIRNINLYCFQRVRNAKSPDVGAYHHPMFKRGEVEMCLKMTRPKRPRHDGKKSKKSLPGDASAKEASIEHIFDTPALSKTLRRPRPTHAPRALVQSNSLVNKMPPSVSKQVETVPPGVNWSSSGSPNSNLTGFSQMFSMPSSSGPLHIPLGISPVSAGTMFPDNGGSSLGNLMRVGNGITNHSFQSNHPEINVLRMDSYNFGLGLKGGSSETSIKSDEDIIPAAAQHQVLGAGSTAENQWMVDAALNYDLWESLDKGSDDGDDEVATDHPETPVQVSAQQNFEKPTEDWNEDDDLDSQISLLDAGADNNEDDLWIADEEGIDTIFGAKPQEIGIRAWV